MTLLFIFASRDKESLSLLVRNVVKVLNNPNIWKKPLSTCLKLKEDDRNINHRTASQSVPCPALSQEFKLDLNICSWRVENTININTEEFARILIEFNTQAYCLLQLLGRFPDEIQCLICNFSYFKETPGSKTRLLRL